jgi:hypothetical protein
MNFWSLPLTSQTIQLGEDEKAQAKISSTNVLLDTGLSYSMVPAKDVAFISKLLEDHYGIICHTSREELETRGSSLAHSICD